MGQLRLVNRDDHRQEAHADTSDQPSDVEHRNDDAGGLDGTAHNEDAAGHQDGSSSAERVREAGEEGSAEAAGRKEGDDRA